MKVIFYNDDFGLSTGFTNAIIDSIKTGITTSSCVRTNGSAFNYSSKLLKEKKLKKYITGIHFNLTDGQAENKNLRDIHGNFKYSYFKYVFSNKELLVEIKKEFILQLEKALTNGYKIDHINSQEHVHMIPCIFRLCCEIANEYNIKQIRICNEYFYLTNNINSNITTLKNTNLIKHLLLNFFSRINIKTAKKYHLTSPDSFCGVLFTNNMSTESVILGIKKAKKNKVKILEVLGHPAYPVKDKKWTSKAIKNYVFSKERQVETNTFLDKNKTILNFLKSNKIHSVSYSDLS